MKSDFNTKNLSIMKIIMETQDGKESITFEKKYYIIQGNHGNHTGYNRQWTINANGYNTKK